MTPKKTVPPMALAFLVACLAGPPVVAADTNDQAYLDGLRANGISVGTAAGLIEFGHRICTALDQGTPPRAMADSMIPIFHLTTTQAAFWVGNAIGSYCPWHSNDRF